MEVRLFVEGQEGITWEQWLALAAACEESDLAALFSSDHYASVQSRGERGSLDVWAVLAALAARTERIRLGTLVSPVTFRHPSVLAKAVATVDHVSGGRAELGLGAGWFEREHAAYGFPFPTKRERWDMVAEQLEILHGQWSEGEFSFRGARYELERCSGRFEPLQQPRPPLILGGGGGPRSVELAARWADEYNVVRKPPEECRRVRERLTEACERRERDPATLRLSLMNATLVGADDHELAARERRVAERTGNPPDDTWTMGTVDEVVGQLHDLAAAGVERVYVQHLLHDDLDMVRLIGREIVPRLAR